MDPIEPGTAGAVATGDGLGKTAALGAIDDVGPPAPAASRGMSLRRMIGTLILAGGLLAVGGASVAMAASPQPSGSTSPSTQAHPGTHAYGSMPGGCQHNGSGSSGSSGSSGATSAPSSSSSSGA